MATVIALICLPILFVSCQKDDPEEPTSKINYHFAAMAEGQQLLAANNEFYNSFEPAQHRLAHEEDWRHA